MAKPSEVTESSMEEILASIRKIISEDESKAANVKPVSGPMPGPVTPSNNVSRLFGDDPLNVAPAPSDGGYPETPEILPQIESVQLSDVLTWPDDESGDAALDAGAMSADALETTPATPETVPATATANAGGGSLLSPGADAAVASAFSQLASTILSNNSRTVEQLAEEMMRPMLKDWLDENLPPLVERLVREEIERVSRRR